MYLLETAGEEIFQKLKFVCYVYGVGTPKGLLTVVKSVLGRTEWLVPKSR